MTNDNEPPKEIEWKTPEWLSRPPEEEPPKTPAELLDCLLSMRKIHADSRDSDVTGSFALLSVKDALNDIRRLDFADIPDVPERPENIEQARWALDRLIEWIYAKIDDGKQTGFQSSDSSKQKAVHTGGSAKLSASELALKYGVDKNKLRHRLERWRHDNDTGYVEVEHHKPREPKYLYDESAVKPVINRLGAKTGSERAANTQRKKF